MKNGAVVINSWFGLNIINNVVSVSKINAKFRNDKINLSSTEQRQNNWVGRNFATQNFMQHLINV